MTTDEKIEALLEAVADANSCFQHDGNALIAKAEAVVNIVEEQRKALDAVRRHFEANGIYKRGCLTCSPEGRVFLQVKMTLEPQEKK